MEETDGFKHQERGSQWNCPFILSPYLTSLCVDMKEKRRTTTRHIKKFPFFHFLSIINNESIFIWCIIKKMERQTCVCSIRWCFIKNIFVYETHTDEIPICIVCCCDIINVIAMTIQEKFYTMEKIKQKEKING